MDKNCRKFLARNAKLLENKKIAHYFLIFIISRIEGVDTQVALKTLISVVKSRILFPLINQIYFRNLSLLLIRGKCLIAKI